MTELKIVNMWQAIFYMKHGVMPARVELGNGDKMIYVFYKEQTFKLYSEWIEQCKNYKNKRQN